MKRKQSSMMLTGVLAAAVVGASVLVGCSMQKPTAADAKTKAISAYQELLKEAPALEGEHVELENAAFGYEENLAKFGKHYDYFTVADLNNDGTPELIAMTVVNSRWTPVSMFTDRDGIQLLKNPMEPDAHGTFEQMSTAGGENTLYICRDNHIHSMWSGDTPVGYQEENHAFILTANGLETAECSLSSGDAAMRFADAAVKNTEANRAAMPGMENA